MPPIAWPEAHVSSASYSREPEGFWIEGKIHFFRMFLFHSMTAA